MSQFTEKDAIELDMPLELCHKWQFVMDSLWCFFLTCQIAEKNTSVINEDNLIKFQLKDGNKFEIGVNFVNSKYLSLFIKIEGNDEFEATINNIDAFGEEGIVEVVANILSFAENVK